MRTMLLLASLSGCAADRPAEDPSAWFSPAQDYDVQETISWTTEPYGDLGGDTEISTLTGRVFPVDSFTDIVYGSGETGFHADSACDTDTNDALPAEVTGVVTLHPSLYYKTDGCMGSTELGDSDEKYYTSYMVEDDSDALFVLSDSRVAHFTAGDVVTLRVRAVRTSYDLDLVYAHDVLSVDRDTRALHYVDVTEGELSADMVPRVHRVTGTLVGYEDWQDTCSMDPGNAEQFGEFLLQADDGVCHSFSLGLELGRRGLTWDPGTRLSVTGPVLDSFGIKIVVELIGQIEVLGSASGDDAAEDDTAD